MSDPRCAKCGHPRSNHPYRHPFVGSSKDDTAEEKDAFPTHETTGGYLRVNDMKAEWAKAYASATPEDIELTKALPAFDADVFLEITGIDLREDKPADAPCEGREVEIDGVTYVLKAKGETE